MSTPVKKGGWGSLLSGAVANLESRLDTILADETDPSARPQPTKQTSRTGQAKYGAGGLAPPRRDGSTQPSRDVSRSRVNERLAERLARATATRSPSSQVSSAEPSRAATPVGQESTRSSVDSRRSIEVTVNPAIAAPELDEQEQASMKEQGETKSLETIEGETNGNAGAAAIDKTSSHAKEGEDVEPAGNGTLHASSLPINPAMVFVETPRQSFDVSREAGSSRPSSEFPNGTVKNSTELDPEFIRMQREQAETESQRKEEMQMLLEKVDALQAKLQYLANETVAAAKEANASTSTSSEAKSLAAKDEKIAMLMEEGAKLSKTELKHLQTIKKLRVKGGEDEKSRKEISKRLDVVERSESDLKAKLRRLEVVERQGAEKAKQISTLEKQVDSLHSDLEGRTSLLASLTVQLKESKEKTERAEREIGTKAAEVDRKKIASLENELEDARIEKKLAEDRAASEGKKARDSAVVSEQRFSVRELELKNEIYSLESRLEALRSRAEEASTEGNSSSDSNVKLLRQIETLQSQYTVAKDNWETIESSLNARLSTTEKDRDDTTRREAELRKRLREASAKIKKTDEESESASDLRRSQETELRGLRDDIRSLKSSLEKAELALAEAHTASKRQSEIWDAQLAQRVEEEKAKWVHDTIPKQPSPAASGQNPITSRQTSASNIATLNTSRRAGRGLTVEALAQSSAGTVERPVSRRSSAFPSIIPSSASTIPERGRPTLGRDDSSMYSLEGDAATDADDFPAATPISPSPDRTIADFVSHSGAAGPSVQLVERMSAAVRRLESEKAVFKEELARLTAQRDGARDEMVALMREIDGKRGSDQRAEALDTEIHDLRTRYDGALELLGEREEQVEELRGDVAELKRIYRELADRKMTA